MAHGKSLELAKIQPHPRQGAHTPNEWRRLSSSEAKKAGITRRRWLKADRRAKRAEV